LRVEVVANYCLLGNIEHVGPQQFLVLASAVPDQSEETTTVKTVMVSSRAEAVDVLETLLRGLGLDKVAEGHCVVDVLTPR
jgi:hypothetical protein